MRRGGEGWGREGRAGEGKGGEREFRRGVVGTRRNWVVPGVSWAQEVGATARYARSLLALAQGSPGAAQLQQQGANIEVELYVPATGRSETVLAQIDTGSTDSGASAAKLQALGAPVLSTIGVSTPGGSSTDSVYAAQLLYQGVDLTRSLPLGGLIGEDLPAPLGALIGRDVLEFYDLTYQGALGTWTLSGQVLAPLPPLSARVGLGAGLLALGALLALGTEGLERRHLARLRREGMR